MRVTLARLLWLPLLSACAGKGDIRSVDSSAAVSAPVVDSAALARADSVVQDSLRAAALDSAKRAQPFVRLAGHMVRGTDELSFRPCGTKKTLLLRGRGDAMAILFQNYRFRATGMLSAIYFVVQAREVPDSIVIGEHTYRAALEVQSVDAAASSQPAECANPGRGSLIAPR